MATERRRGLASWQHQPVMPVEAGDHVFTLLGGGWGELAKQIGAQLNGRHVIDCYCCCRRAIVRVT